MKPSIQLVLVSAGILGASLWVARLIQERKLAAANSVVDAFVDANPDIF